MPTQASEFIRCGRSRSDGWRDVDGTVIVDAGEDVERVARRDRARRFILTLQVGVAVGQRRPRDDVDVRARHDLLCRNVVVSGEDECEGYCSKPPDVATDQNDACAPCAAEHAVAERFGSLSAGGRACAGVAPERLPIPMPRVTACRVREQLLGSRPKPPLEVSEKLHRPAAQTPLFM